MALGKKQAVPELGLPWDPSQEALGPAHLVASQFELEHYPWPHSRMTHSKRRLGRHQSPVKANPAHYQSDQGSVAPIDMQTVIRAQLQQKGTHNSYKGHTGVPGSGDQGD